MTMDPATTGRVQQLRNLKLFFAMECKTGQSDIAEESIIDEVKKCLREGADIDAVNYNDEANTVLHVAIILVYKTVIKFLLESGVRVDIKNSQGLTALALAQKRNYEQDIIDLIEDYAKSITDKLIISYWSKNQIYWNKLRNNSEIAVLEVNSVELSPDFLQQVEFYDAIDTAGNLFFVDVIVSDSDNIDEDFITSQLRKMNKQFILQCGSVSNTKLYYKDNKNNVKVIDLNITVNDYDEEMFIEKLSCEDGFGIDLIVKALKLGFIGKFKHESRSLLDVDFDLEKHFDGWKLIDYSIRYGDVMTVRLLSLSNWNLSKLNDVRTTTLLIAAKYGNMDKLAALFKIKFPVPLDDISFPDQYYSSKETLLQAAVEAGNCDGVSFMIRCGFQLDDNIINLAWDERLYYVVFVLLKADCVFPSEFDLNEIVENDERLEKLRTFVKERDDLHSSIEGGCLDKVKEKMNSLITPSTLYLNKKNESALYKSLKCNALDTFVYLKCVVNAKFKNSDEKENISVGVLDSATHAIIPQCAPVDNAHIHQLVSRSRCLHQYDGFEDQIKNIYMELDKIPQISVLFKVIHFRGLFIIIYDFDKESIVDIKLSSRDSVRGECDYKLVEIYIGAKGLLLGTIKDKKELLGTIAHELTHLAMQTVYNNKCNPYALNDPKKDHFKTIVEEFRGKSKQVDEKLDDIIKKVFGYPIDEQPSELIVRINHILGRDGLNEGLSLLKEQASTLLKYYQETVTPCCDKFVRESHLINPRLRIKELNDYGGITCKLEESQIRFKESINLAQVFNESEVQIAVVTSTSPFLSTMSVYQSLKDNSRQPNSFLFFNFDGYIKRKSEINKAFYFDVCKFLVVLCDSDPDENVLRESLKTLLDLIKIKPDKKIIFIMESSKIFEEGIIVIEPKFTLKDLPKVEYTLDDVSEESAVGLLGQTVSLQSRDAKLSDIINKEHYRLVDAQTLIKLINKQHIDIGKQIITSSNYDEHFYVDRMFSYQAVIKEEILKDENKLTMYAISDLDEPTLVSLVKNKDSVCTYECLSSGSDRRHIILDSSNGAQQYEQLCQQFTQHTIHWLKKVEGGLYWLKTRSVYGQIERLQEFVNDELIRYFTEDDLTIDTEKRRVFVVSDTPGMGKSTVLTSIAHRLIKRYPHLWVIRIDLNDYSKILDEEQNNNRFDKDDLSGALEFLVDRLLRSRDESRHETEFERNLLLHFLQNNEDRVVIMFDGFDEIKKTHQNVILNLLVALKSSKVKQLWVTTRPHLRKTLENTLHHLSYTLQRINEVDQVKFLTRFWRLRLNLVIEPDVGSGCSFDTKLQCFAEALIKLLSKSISDREKVFTGVPLQLRMIAECFEEKAEYFCRSHRKQPQLPLKLKLNDIYQKFFNRKYEIFQSQKNSVDFSKLNWDSQNDVLNKYFLDNHGIVSLFIHFEEKELDLLLTRDEINRGASFISDISSCSSNTGIIDLIIEGKPRFVHLTFAEYLTAEFIMELLAKEQPNIEQMKLIWTKVLVEENFIIVRSFIDSHLGQKTLTDAVLNEHGRVLRSMWSKKPNTYIPRLGQFFSGVFRGDKKCCFFPERRKICDVFLVAAQEGNANLAKFLIICFGDRNITAKLIKWVDDDQNQPLHLAARRGHLDVVKLLVEFKANVNDLIGHAGEMYEGFSALLLAAYFGHTAVCEWLIKKGADINAIVNVEGFFKGHNVLHLAAGRGHLDVVKMLKDIGEIDFNALVGDSSDYNGMNALHIAAFSNHWDVVKWIVSEGLIDINVINPHYPRIGLMVLNEAVISDMPEMVEWLIEHGADVNLTGSLHKSTALHLAVRFNRLKVAEVLVSNGANVNAVSFINKSPLHYAAERGFEQLVEFLLTVKNINVNAVDGFGCTPLQLASMKHYQSIMKMIANFMVKSGN